MVTLNFKQFKKAFFDRKAITGPVDTARRKVLSKIGAFVRRRAQTSIRKRKGISTPGGPPHSHTGLLRKFLFFAYDSTRESVIIGPARLNGPSAGAALPALEYGGVSSTLRTSYESGRRVRHRHQIFIAPRPFMGPALAAEAPNFAPLWRDSIR